MYAKKSNTKTIKNSAKFKLFIIASPLIISITLIIFAAFNLAFWERIYPNIYVGGVNLGGKTSIEASLAMSSVFMMPEKIVLTSQDQTYDIPTDKIGLKYDFNETFQHAFGLARTGNYLYDAVESFSQLVNEKAIGLSFTLDEGELAKALSTISGQVSTESIPYGLEVENGNINVVRGITGLELDGESLRMQIGTNIAGYNFSAIGLPLRKTGTVLTDSEADNLKARAEKIFTKTLTLKSGGQSFKYSGEDIINILDGKGEYYQTKIDGMAAKIAGGVNTEPVDSQFVFENGRASEFIPSKDGVIVNQNLLVLLIAGNLRTLESTDESQITVDIPTTHTSPKVALKDINNLGIRELLGRGTSKFAGSIANRIYNISLASSKFKGFLIPPGEVVSVNDTLGDVSSLTGYKQAYIIKEGKTILGDGGGVCQVSTTLFRAALAAGLPILERTAHAYRVYYYEQDSPPGIDATVYSPTPDLKFLNDTPGYILIQPVFDAKTVSLAFEIYGTGDGRAAAISKPVITNQIAPPEDVYRDDPTLKAGVIKQTEHKTWGAKVTFNYTVTRNGETIFQKKFISNYRPWGNVFLRGTGQ